MTGPGAHHGRRDNGLYAATYAAVGDVDPRIGEHLLDVLGNRGIAAYLQPTSDQHPITRLTTLPARPTDRLYVDRTELDTARSFLETLTKDAEETKEPVSTTPSAGTDIDEAWASIVAGYDRTAGEGPAPWPEIEDVDREGTGTRTARPADDPPPATDYPRWRSGDQGSLLDGFDRLGQDVPDTHDDEDDVYHPPTPPPLPRLATITIVAVIGIIAGLAVVADPDLLPIDPTAAFMLGCLCVVAGGVALIGRLRSGKDDEPDDPDHGAVV